MHCDGLPDSCGSRFAKGFITPRSSIESCEPATPETVVSRTGRAGDGPAGRRHCGPKPFASVGDTGVGGSRGLICSSSGTTYRSSAGAQEASQQWTGTFNPRKMEVADFQQVYRNAMQAGADVS